MPGHGSRPVPPEPEAALGLAELLVFLAQHQIDVRVVDGARYWFRSPCPLLNDGLVSVLQRHRRRLLAVLPAERVPG